MKKVLILTITLFITIFVVVILGNVITIGEKFTTVFGVPYFEYGLLPVVGRTICISGVLCHIGTHEAYSQRSGVPSVGSRG